MSAPSTLTRAGGRRHQPHDHGDGGGLAGAVAAEQAGDRAGRERERNAVDGGGRLVDLDQALDGDGGGVGGIRWPPDVTPAGKKRKPRAPLRGLHPRFRRPARARLDWRHVRLRPRPQTTRAATCGSIRWCGCAGSPSSARPPRCWWSSSGSTFSLPIWACLSVIALSAWLNVALRLRFHIDAAARARPRRLAARLRHRRTRGAAVPDRRLAEPVRVFVSRSGAAVGDRAAAALHHAARRRSRSPARPCSSSCITRCLGRTTIRCGCRRSISSAYGWRSCSRSASSASTPGRSPRNRASWPMPLRQPNWCWRASSIFPSSTGWPPPPRTNWRRRSRPSP